MVYGVKCHKCGLMQMPKPTCKACGAVLEIPAEAPLRTSSTSTPRPLSKASLEAPSIVPSEPPSNYQTSGRTNRCSECGMEFSDDELIRIADTQVCAKCKPIIVQRLREGVTLDGEMVYAGFWIRVGAKIIDAIILTVVTFALGFLVNFIVRHTVAGAILQNIISSVLGIFYTIYFLGKYSATPGKMACGLKVVRPDGEGISYARACGRFFAELLSSMILCIGYILVAFDEEKRALHDRICDTRVIRA